MLILDLYRLRAWPYRHACESPTASYWVSGFIVATGMIYGLLVAAFQRWMGGDLQGFPVDQISGLVLFGGNVLAGILITIMVHIGFVLVSWLAARGVGGPGLFGCLYKATAYLLPLLIGALPQAALTAAIAGRDVPAPAIQPLTVPLAVLSVAMFLFGLFQVMRLTQDISARRAAGAVGIFVVFCIALFLIV
jgi:hypothetical protein